MFGFLKQVGDYTRDAVDAARNLAQGFAVTFDHMQRRPVTVQYPYEKLIPSERYRGRIHYEFDKCIACEVCVRVCPINLPVVDWVMNKATRRKSCGITPSTLVFVFSVEIALSTARPIACR
jgi:NAD(P)H-quinone oxidoreductase subunit I